jgi:hypothetical protein
MIPEIFAGSANGKRYMCDKTLLNFDVLLTVHLSIILVINQLNAQVLVL